MSPSMSTMLSHVSQPEGRNLSSSKHTPETYVALAETGLNNEEIALKLNVGETTVRRGLRKAGYRRLVSPLALGTDDFLDKPIRHYGPIAITADWHVPLVDYAYANKFLDHVTAEGYKTLAIAGDFFNVDALSAFDYKQESANLSTELEQANHIMGQLCNQFDRIIFTWGNHDARMWKALQYKLSFVATMRLCFGDLGAELLDKIEFSNLDHFWVNDSIYVCHPKTYSQIPLTSARKIASKVGASVITAHSHHAAMGYDVSGKYVCVEAGGLFDASKTAYLQRSTGFPNWKQGFSLVDEQGHISMYTPEWSCRA